MFGKIGLYEGKMVRLRDVEPIRVHYPPSMLGIMLLGKQVKGFDFEVLCEDNQIRLARVNDLEAV